MCPATRNKAEQKTAYNINENTKTIHLCKCFKSTVCTAACYPIEIDIGKWLRKYEGGSKI